MTLRVKLLLAALAVTVGGIAAGTSTGTMPTAAESGVEAVFGAEGTAHASIGDCSASRNGLTETAICYSITAGGPQRVRAVISCAYGVVPNYTKFVDSSPNYVLETSTVTARAGGWGCFGGYERV